MYTKNNPASQNHGSGGGKRRTRFKLRSVRDAGDAIKAGPRGDESVGQWVARACCPVKMEMLALAEREPTPNERWDEDTFSERDHSMADLAWGPPNLVRERTASVSIGQRKYAARTRARRSRTRRNSVRSGRSGGGARSSGSDGSGDADADGSHTRAVHLPPSSTHHVAPRQHNARSLTPGGAR